MNSFVDMKNLLRICFTLLLTLWSVKSKAQEARDSTEVQEITVFTTRSINASGARYHVDGCRYLKNGQIHIDERQAIRRGLLPCSICLPSRTSELAALREEKKVEKKAVYRKCVFKTSSGAKCERPAIKDNRYCELHKSRAKKPAKKKPVKRK